MKPPIEYQREWRSNFKGCRCACGNAAVMLVCGDKVCAFCGANTRATKSGESRKATAGRREPKGGWPGYMYDEKPEPFTPSVQFNGDRLVIDGHGHYEMKV